jgi:hypothetical protein
MWERARRVSTLKEKPIVAPFGVVVASADRFSVGFRRKKQWRTLRGRITSLIDVRAKEKIAR